MSNLSIATENLHCDIYEAVEKLYRSLHIGLSSHNKLGYTCGQGKMLRVLAEQGKASQSSLSSLLGITASSASEIADKLLSTGYISREADSSDKRKSLLCITESGISELVRLREEFTSFVASSFASLNQDELKQLLFLLNKLTDPVSIKQDAFVQPHSIRRGTRL